LKNYFKKNKIAFQSKADDQQMCVSSYARIFCLLLL